MISSLDAGKVPPPFSNLGQAKTRTQVFARARLFLGYSLGTPRTFTPLKTWSVSSRHDDECLNSDCFVFPGRQPFRCSLTGNERFLCPAVRLSTAAWNKETAGAAVDIKGFILFIVLLPSSASVRNLFTFVSERHADVPDVVYCPARFSLPPSLRPSVLPQLFSQRRNKHRLQAAFSQSGPGGKAPAAEPRDSASVQWTSCSAI